MKKKSGKEEEEMFYSHCLLSRKGPFGVIWIAAHCYRKLRKVQVVETDISYSVDKIALAEVPIAFRVLGHLLIGVVRIYAKKVEYLYHDCNEALIRVRDSFASGKISLSKEVRHAPYISITLPKRFELDAFNLEDMDMEDVQCHVRPNKQITLEETRADEANQCYSVDKFHRGETGSYPDFQFPNPMLLEDVFSPHSTDIGLEISDLHNISGFGDSIEKLRGDRLPPEDGFDLEMFHDEAESFDFNQHCDEMGLWVEQTMSVETTLPDFGKSLVLTEGYPLDRTPVKFSDYSSLPNASVSPTPDVMIVPTPSNKEQCRLSRKRKYFLDEDIMLSNEVLRQRIRNASSLVHVRRKAPHTVLDVWKAEKIPNLCQNFMDPLIPCISSEIKALFSKDHLNPLEPVVSKKGLSQLDEVEFETPCRLSDDKAICLVNSVYPLESVRSSESPTTNKSNKLRFDTTTESGSEELSVIETPDLWWNLMDEEISSHEENCQKYDRWSIRTRSAAQYLHYSFQNQEEIISLACQLEGRTRKTCARLFYETLVLKSEGYIDVKQDSPYSEILLLASPRMKATF